MLSVSQGTGHTKKDLTMLELMGTPLGHANYSSAAQGRSLGVYCGIRPKAAQQRVAEF